MKNNKPQKDFSYLGLGRIVTVVFHAVFYLIFASLLDPAKYGEVMVIIALAGTFSVFSRFGLPLSLQVYQAKDNVKVSEQIKTFFIISTSGAALILIMIEPIASILCIGISLFTMNMQNLLGLKNYKIFMINSIFKSSTFIVIPLILFLFFEIPGILLGMAISNLISGVPILRKFRLQSSFEELKKIYKVLLHNFGVDSAGNLSVMIDKLLISFLLGYFVVGIYQFNLQIMIALGTLPGILSSYLISEESSGESHGKITKIILIMAIAMTTIAIILAPFFVNSFFPKYSEGIFALQIMILTIIPQTIAAIFGPKLLAKESTKIGYSAIVKVGSLLLLIWVLGTLYNFIGLAMAVLFSTIFNTIFLYWLYRKYHALSGIV